VAIFITRLQTLGRWSGFNSRLQRQHDCLDDDADVDAEMSEASSDSASRRDESAPLVGLLPMQLQLKFISVIIAINVQLAGERKVRCLQEDV